MAHGVRIRFRGSFALLAVASMCFPVTASAVEFAIVGPRAVGMGGAGVAVTDDALATYWNPAGLAMSKTVDIRVQGSGHGVDRLGVLDAVKEINDLDLKDASAANLSRAQALVDKINQPGASLSASGAAGIYLKGYLGNHAFGFNVSDVATAGAFLPSPVRVTSSGSNLTIDGQYVLKGLEAK
ncbi:MAG: hypothetical protein C4294_04375, partial [Nitrospiraceae bacterium]